MAHPGSVCGIAVNALIVSGNQHECSIPSARSNSFCASGVQEVLNSTWPSFSFFCWASSWPSAAADANTNSDATIAEMSLGFMDVPPREDENHYTLGNFYRGSFRRTCSCHSKAELRNCPWNLARPARIERATYGFGGHHSIP